jgi:predicted permease
MFSQLRSRATSLWRGIRRGPAVDAEMSDEFRTHMELRADDLVRQGRSRADALRQARLEFGSTEHYKDRGRESRGLASFDRLLVSWLDFKLGFRMLGKHPGLTIVGGIAIAFAVAVGSTAFEFVTQYLHPRLGIPDGDRFVAVRLWSAKTGTDRRTIHDVVRWRRELKTIESIGAVRTIQRNLIPSSGAVGDPIIGAEISASAFRLAGASPLRGRLLTEDDERADAAPVAVISYDLWQTRFGADSNIVGRSIRVGGESVTVVGVMPKGFAFPVYHELWVPLHLDALAAEAGAGRGPILDLILGRIAPGSSVADAQSELDAIGLRGAEPREAYAKLRPAVKPFAAAISDSSGEAGLMLYAMNTFLVMLLALVFANVALLVFARAATRESEIVVRTALGASRSRIVTQLFAEALVLGAFASVVGLATSAVAWRWSLGVFARAQGGRLPFWFHSDLSPTTVIYATFLVVFGAAIAGIIPALKVTRGIESHLRRAAANSGGLQFGGIWTAVIVAQVAVTVAFPVTAFFSWRDAKQVRSAKLGVRASEFLTARLQMDREGAATAGDTSQAALARRFATASASLGQRFEVERGVAGVAVATLLPGMDHPQRSIALDDSSLKNDSTGLRVSSVRVSRDYFSALGATIAAGRAFVDPATDDAQSSIVVNQTFVREVLGGLNPIGRRVRYVPRFDTDEDGANNDAARRWYTIVGVVSDLGMSDGSDPHESGAGIYHPLVPGSATEAFIAVRVRGDPRALGPNLRVTAATIDPTLRITEITPLDEVQASNIESTVFIFRALLGVTAVALLLSLAGIYSVMAFTVARRTREIGVRVALGSSKRQIVATIFARPLKQVAFGIVIGMAIVTTLVKLVLESITVMEAGAIAGYATLMLAICLLACVVPTRRALGIQPTEALRADG